MARNENSKSRFRILVGFFAVTHTQITLGDHESKSDMIVSRPPLPTHRGSALLSNDSILTSNKGPSQDEIVKATLVLIFMQYASKLQTVQNTKLLIN